MTYESHDEHITGMSADAFDPDDKPAIGTEPQVQNDSLFQLSNRWSRITKNGADTEIVGHFVNHEGFLMKGEVEIHAYESGNYIANGYIVDSRPESIGAAILIASGIENPAEVITLVENAMGRVSLKDLVPPEQWLDSGYY